MSFRHPLAPVVDLDEARAARRRRRELADERTAQARLYGDLSRENVSWPIPSWWRPSVAPCLLGRGDDDGAAA